MEEELKSEHTNTKAKQSGSEGPDERIRKPATGHTSNTQAASPPTLIIDGAQLRPKSSLVASSGLKRKKTGEQVNYTSQHQSIHKRVLRDSVVKQRLNKKKRSANYSLNRLSSLIALQKNEMTLRAARKQADRLDALATNFERHTISQSVIPKEDTGKSEVLLMALGKPPAALPDQEPVEALAEAQELNYADNYGALAQQEYASRVESGSSFGNEHSTRQVLMQRIHEKRHLDVPEPAGTATDSFGRNRMQLSTLNIETAEIDVSHRGSASRNKGTNESKPPGSINTMGSAPVCKDQGLQAEQGKPGDRALPSNFENIRELNKMDIRYMRQRGALETRHSLKSRSDQVASRSSANKPRRVSIDSEAHKGANKKRKYYTEASQAKKQESSKQGSTNPERSEQAQVSTSEKSAHLRFRNRKDKRIQQKVERDLSLIEDAVQMRLGMRIQDVEHTQQALDNAKAQAK